MYTHICIETVNPNPRCPHIPVLIKKGDFCTCNSTKPHMELRTKIGIEFKEQLGAYYCSSAFLPLPPQQEKTVYVAVSETLKETILEPILN